MEVVRKITVKVVNGGNRPAAFPEDAKMGEKRHLITVIGRASKAEEKSTTMLNGDQSEYLRFRGSFAAWKGDIGDGIEYRSGAMILPGVAADFLAGSFASEDTQSVDFAFKIGIKKSDSPVQYDYTCEPIVQDAEDSDPLKAIQAKVKEAQKVLPKGKAA